MSIMAKNDKNKSFRRKHKEIEEEALRRKYPEEILDRNAKATVQWNYNCSVKVAKFQIKKEPLIKPVTCEKCGKSFKTNSNKKICFDCQKNKLK